MRPIQDSFSIVIVGSWNHRIFSENWVAENLAKDAGSKVSLAFPIGDPGAPNRLEFENILMFASPGNIRLTPKEQTLEGLNYCREIAVRILETLSHTPISAFGVNFQFQEDEEIEKIWEISGVAPLFETKADLEMPLSGLSLSRQFSLSARVQLNHKISGSSEEGAAIFEFNYHHGNEDAKSAFDILSTDVVTQYYNNAKAFIRSYYDVELPE